MALHTSLRPIDLARATGIGVQQVRNYESWGLLPPASRSKSGYRLYTQHHLAALKTARSMIGGYSRQRTLAIKKGRKTMDDILEDFTISALLKAMEANVHELWTRFGRVLGAEVHDESALLWFASDLLFELANGIVRTSLPSDNLERTLDETLKRLTSQHVPMAWLTGPSTRPRDLGKRLQENGWVFGDEAPGMAVELHTLDERLSLPSELTIARVSDDESLRTWIRVMTVGSELPEFLLTILLEVADKHSFKTDPAIHFYLGMLGGKAVATSLLYLGGGVAGIYNVSTLPELRKQGIGTALTVAPLLDARAWGYQIGTLQSTQMGLHLYRRLGFQEYCTFNAYFWSGEALETE